ncbi:HD repeat domain-containing isoform B [Chlorella sorokiniana]|uniref:HD repeat domain-containing isoform B n=1 Tax=Chlorella sorokiniana TaxID=3076 RepID=A0A2P6U0T4_CHLSO|nr:HD repeat domain-containing isoform B [Chlorella sorokiniana]|eukprot:PRW59926.1 HD repeat domain-containing isoform B [Chlorella sorokiniana]
MTVALGAAPAETHAARVQQTCAWVKQQIAAHDSSHDWFHIERVTNAARSLAAAEGLTEGEAQLAELAALLHESMDHKYSADPAADRQALLAFLAGELQLSAEQQEVILYAIEQSGFKEELARQQAQQAQQTQQAQLGVPAADAGQHQQQGAAAGQPQNSDSTGQQAQQTQQAQQRVLAVLQDADRLDAIGAIGIARCLTFGGRFNRVLHDPAVPPRLELTKEQYANKAAAAQQTTINHFHEKLLKLKGLMRTAAGRRLAEERHTFMEQFLERFTPGVLLFQNDKPNSTELADSPAWNDWYVKSGGCANEDIAKYYPQDVPACRACHAAMTRRACLAIQAANEYNALSMSCTWRGPQQKADSRTTRPGGRQPQPKAMEVLWSVGINEPSGFLHTLANDTCSVTAEFETDRQSASRFQARLNWQMLGPAKTPDGNTPAGLNRDVSCMLYGNKRKCSYTINRPAFSKYLWLNNQFTTRDQAVIANLASIPYDCFYAKNCTTAFSFKYNMRLTEHPCKPGTAPRFAAVSQGSLLTSNYATALLPGKEGLSGDSFSIGYFPLVGAKAARWNLSWGRSPTLSPIIALLNTTNLWAKACTADSKDPAVYVCDFHKLRPWAIGNRWCTKRTCADQILEMPQLNE